MGTIVCTSQQNVNTYEDFLSEEQSEERFTVRGREVETKSMKGARLGGGTQSDADPERKNRRDS